jgi:hypothetical protein
MHLKHLDTLERQIQATRILFNEQTGEDVTRLLNVCDRLEKHIEDQRSLRLNKAISCGDSRTV